MFLKAYAKINIGLHVGEKLPNGYHSIDTIMQQVDWYDEMFFSLLPEREIKIESNIDIPIKDNLIYKAASAFMQLTGTKYGLHVKIRKNIPAGKGLGGGSSNAANTFLAFNTLIRNEYNDEIDINDLLDMSKEIGSDIAYFFYGEPSYVGGIGDVVLPLPEMPQYNVLLIIPNFSIATGLAYKKLSVWREKNNGYDKEYHGQIKEWYTKIADYGFRKELFEILENDFEKIIFDKYPVLGEIKNELNEQGSIYPSLTGTGSAMYGLFENPIDDKVVNYFKEKYPDYTIKVTKTI